METGQEQLSDNLKQIDEIEQLNLDIFKQVTKELLRNLQELSTKLDTLSQMAKVVAGMQENQKMIIEKLTKQKIINDMFNKYIEATNSILENLMNE